MTDGLSTVSALELVRLAVALAGIRASWHGRAFARNSQNAIPLDPTDDLYERASRQQRDARMELLGQVQTGILLAHLLFLVNVVANMFYAGAPIEQPNVLTSNVAQILIPMILTKMSEMIAMEMKAAIRLHLVVGARPPQKAGR